MIYDLTGRCILQSKIENPQSEIIVDISHLQAGIYFLKTCAAKHLNETVKIVKE